MTIDIQEQEDVCLINIDGTAINSNDYKEIVKSLEECTDSTKSLEINISNAFTIASSLIGALLKKTQADNFFIKINVQDDSLYELFETLNLVDALNVSKV